MSVWRVLEFLVVFGQTNGLVRELGHPWQWRLSLWVVDPDLRKVTKGRFNSLHLLVHTGIENLLFPSTELELKVLTVPFDTSSEGLSLVSTRLLNILNKRETTFSHFSAFVQALPRVSFLCPTLHEFLWRWLGFHSIQNNEILTLHFSSQAYPTYRERTWKRGVEMVMSCIFKVSGCGRKTLSEDIVISWCPSVSSSTNLWCSFWWCFFQLNGEQFYLYCFLVLFFSVTSQ